MPHRVFWDWESHTSRDSGISFDKFVLFAFKYILNNLFFPIYNYVFQFGHWDVNNGLKLSRFSMLSYLF